MVLESGLDGGKCVDWYQGQITDLSYESTKFVFGQSRALVYFHGIVIIIVG